MSDEKGNFFEGVSVYLGMGIPGQTDLSEKVIEAAMRVHGQLGPGLLESAYEACLAFELTQWGMKVERQKALPLRYRDLEIDCGYRLDLLVEDRVIVELKASAGILPVHVAQALTYLKLSRKEVCLILNFNQVSLKLGGIRRLTLREK